MRAGSPAGRGYGRSGRRSETRGRRYRHRSPPYVPAHAAGPKRCARLPRERGNRFQPHSRTPLARASDRSLRRRSLPPAAGA